MANVTLGEEINIPTQSVTSQDPYGLDTSSYGDISVENLYAMGEPVPENKNVLPSLLKPLLFAGAGLLAYFSFK